MALRITLVLVILTFSCHQQVGTVRKVYKPLDISPDETLTSKKLLKVHQQNGFITLLKTWEADDNNRMLTGEGYAFTPDRTRIGRGAQLFELSYDNIVLVETNEYTGFNGLSPALMTLNTVFSVVNAICLFDPKACFGSCPTFYLHKNNEEILQAEGFSSSISKSMEDVDIDVLPSYNDQDTGLLKIEIKNEAYETHYVRKVEILAVPEPLSGEIVHSKNRFYHVSDLLLPVNVEGISRDQLSLFASADHEEYAAHSDSLDLTKKESVILEFENVSAENTGVLITQRQSLMTTFLFYQSLAYMGSGTGEIMAAYERSVPWIREAQKSIYDILGGVEVSVMIDGRWKLVGTVNEQGPIASDRHFLPVETNGTFHKVRLTMTKGLWRIDQVALCQLRDEVEPYRILPHALLDQGIENQELLFDLNDPDQFMMNQPGTSYTLCFQLPYDAQWVPFIKSQGYYTEWMRGEWLQEEDPEMTEMIIFKPKKWLKLMAPRYKVVESQMDSLFWESKFEKDGS